MSRILVVAEEGTFEDRAAREILGCLAAAQQDGAVASLALSGGSTPRSVYPRLASRAHSSGVEWGRVEVFWSDERCVGPHDPASNYRLARETLLAPLTVSAARVHRVEGEMDPEIAAEIYDAEIRRILPGEPPRLDLVLLGLGMDGHTASLFPGEPTGRGKRLVIVGAAPSHPAARVSMSLRLMNAARQVLFLVAGAAKRSVVAQILSGRAPELPAAQVWPEEGRLVWLLDREAASGLQLL